MTLFIDSSSWRCSPLLLFAASLPLLLPSMPSLVSLVSLPLRRSLLLSLTFFVHYGYASHHSHILQPNPKCESGKSSHGYFVSRCVSFSSSPVRQVFFVICYVVRRGCIVSSGLGTVRWLWPRSG